MDEAEQKIELRPLQLTDGYELYEMLQAIGPGENGFVNSAYGMRRGQFRSFLRQHWNISQGIGLQPQYVQQTIYWLYVNGKAVGYGKLRHRLNEALLERGGHIGYVIRLDERGKGYGTLILRELVREAARLGLTEVLLTVDKDNIRSRKVIEGNGGTLRELKDGICKYWIPIGSDLDV
ncbi:GNAT family N-acetyltransferase [Paenibacillus alvei]|uniref:GNAT family N-acetyltransferase n=1 Tax=Paenibacillus alvei TaxID=44250 RepID=A0AAP6ZRR4_PAEAL|nr:MULTISPECIES: GNAT family N-acetyltransferase [Paenibacillus]EJW17895.1 acetyltransferase, GNAT family [Paenibacillus alvei DSM 29]MCY7483319.1 GNAT family N-acetyltransferase [Paenibacillus alvei]MCY9543817.1 GNAT family N-acetyltransferase [Paenibacillus alvei]MCY9703401.1 GNAT family N-acetyltransferase [Paenibacillus alvei]MCY9738285.1 GNAT family N-acetyltransferase [Paenibacillus alvei]